MITLEVLPPGCTDDGRYLQLFTVCFIVRSRLERFQTVSEGDCIVVGNSIYNLEIKIEKATFDEDFIQTFVTTECRIRTANPSVRLTKNMFKIGDKFYWCYDSKKFKPLKK